MLRSVAALTLTAGLALAPAGVAVAKGGGGSVTTYVCDIASPCKAGDAGTVSLTRSGLTLTVASVSANPGYTYKVEVPSGREPEVTFKSSTSKVQFSAQVEHGTAVKVKVKVRPR